MPDDPDVFKAIKRRLFRSLRAAFESIAFSTYYTDANVTLEIRNGKIVRVEVRELDLTQ